LVVVMTKTSDQSVLSRAGALLHLETGYFQSEGQPLIQRWS